MEPDVRVAARESCGDALLLRDFVDERLAEIVTGAIDGVRLVVDGAGRAARDDAHAARLQAEPHRTGDATIHEIDVLLESIARGIEPQTVVHEPCPLLVSQPLEAILRRRTDEALEVGVRGDEHGCGGRVIDGAGLQTDVAVFDEIAPADSERRTDRVKPGDRVG